MTINESVKLMMDSSNHHPYFGPLTHATNAIAAIELAQLCKKFAENGQTDEAMNLDAEHWQEVINRLKGE